VIGGERRLRLADRDVLGIRRVTGVGEREFLTLILYRRRYCGKWGVSLG